MLGLVFNSVIWPTHQYGQATHQKGTEQTCGRTDRPHCRTFTVHARSLSYIHCTRPLTVVHSLYTPVRCRTFTVHARSLSYIHCTRPLTVVHSLYTPARCRTFTVHARSLSYIHCTRPLTVIHSLHSAAYTPFPPCRLLVVTAPLAGLPYLPSASSPISRVVGLQNATSDTSVTDGGVCVSRAVGSISAFAVGPTDVRRPSTMD